MSVKPQIISKVASYGPQRWRVNPDKSYSVLTFGTSGPNQTPHSFWIFIESNKVPKEIKEILK